MTACVPVAAPLPGTADVRLLEGEFDVTFHATAGPRSGAAAEVARLSLRPQERALAVVDSAARVEQPFVGLMAIDPARLGATSMGDPTASDPMSPGVAAYVTRGGAGEVTSLVVRVGTESNARGRLVYDSGHFTLYVRGVSATGFAGGWTSSSGAGMNPTEASGHFCAVRAAS